MSGDAGTGLQTGSLEQGLAAAQAAVDRGDVDGALAIFAQLRTAFPGAVEPYQVAAFAVLVAQRYDDADALLVAARQRFPQMPGLAIDYAWVAHRRHDVPEAERRWADVRRLFPDHPLGFTGASVTLRESGQLDAAQAMLARGASRFSQEPAFMAERASLAQARGELAEAIQAWADVRHAMPDFWPAYTGAGSALRDLRRFDEADALLTDAAARFPTLPQPTVELAQLAMARRNWPAAIAAWSAVIAKFPDRIEGYIGHARAAREAGRLPDAEQTLRLAVERFPGRAELLIDLAWAVTHQNRHDDSVAIWGAVRTRFPAFITGYTGGAVALANSGRIDDAIALLDRAAELFPGDPGPMTERGWIAMSRADFHGAERLFADVQARFPNYPVAPLGLGRALWRQGRSDEALALLKAAVARFPTFALLAADLAEFGGAPATVAPEPEVPIAQPRIAPAGPVKVAVAGYHLANQLTQILARLAPLRERIAVEWLDFGLDPDATRTRLPPGWLEAADLYIEEGLIGPSTVKSALRSMLPAHCTVRMIPTTGCGSLWPFGGPDARMVPEPPIHNGGRYPHTDRLAASLAGTDMTDDALFDAYMALTEAEALDLDGAYASDLAQWRHDDAACDIELAPFLDRAFRTERLFATPHERQTPILREIVRQLLSSPVLSDIAGKEAVVPALDRLLIGWSASHQGLPVHPRVARQFGLEWWSPDMRYRAMGNEFTFRDYILRYIRWSPWVP